MKPERRRYSVVLLRQLVKTDFKLRYQGSILGYVWSLLKPLALFTILLFVFSNFFRVGNEIEHFPQYLLLGIVVWTFFAEAAGNSLSSIVARGDLLRKINFPSSVIVLSTSFSALINFLINMLVVFTFMLIGGVGLRLGIVLVPFVVLELFVFSLAVSFFLSALYVRFRDISNIWDVIMQGAFYATPILYPVSFILNYSQVATKILMLNPIAQIIQDLRFLLITDQAQRIDQVYGSHWIRLVPLGITALLAILSALYFSSQSKYFAEEL